MALVVKQDGLFDPIAIRFLSSVALYFKRSRSRTG